MSRFATWETNCKRFSSWRHMWHGLIPVYKKDGFLLHLCSGLWRVRGTGVELQLLQLPWPTRFIQKRTVDRKRRQTGQSCLNSEPSASSTLVHVESSKMSPYAAKSGKSMTKTSALKLRPLTINESSESSSLVRSVITKFFSQID